MVVGLWIGSKRSRRTPLSTLDLSPETPAPRENAGAVRGSSSFDELDLDRPIRVRRDNTPAESKSSATPEPRRCPSCDYRLFGLPEAAICPECGWDPSDDQRIVRTDLARSHRLWAGLMLAGLALLSWCSLILLSVTLMMRFRDDWAGSLPLVNFIGPKVSATPLIQRSVGGAPAELGVQGTIWTLLSMVAIWLLTAPRPSESEAETESFINLRKLARWVPLVLIGSVFGMLLSESGIYSWRGGRSNYFLLTIAVCELPATALLYTHLRGVAARLGDRRAELMLAVVAIAAPIIIGGAVGMLLLGETWQSRGDELPQQLIVAGYGGLSLLFGLAAIGALGRLALALLSTMQLGGTPIDKAKALLRSTRDRGAGVSTRRWATACLAVGLVMVLWNQWTTLQAILSLGGRAAVGGDVPVINFFGPAVTIDYPSHNYSYGSAWQAQGPMQALWLAIGLFAITVRNAEIRERWISTRRLLRWVPMIIAGALLTLNVVFNGFANGRWDGLSQQSKALLLGFIALQLPATLLLYLHLSAVARLRGWDDLGKRLFTSGIAATTIMIAAVWMMLGTSNWLEWRADTRSILLVCAYGGVATIISVYATWQVLTLLGRVVAEAIGLTAKPETAT